jgi:hypothetical protein
MRPDAILITQPAIDFAKFVGLTHKMLGYSVASASDAARRPLSETERFLSCLNAMSDEAAPPGLPPHLLSHVSFSVLLGCDERDLLDVLQCCSGMPFVQAETQARGYFAAVVSGTLAQWRDAVESGAARDATPSVRELFNKIMGLFEQHGLSSVWTGYQKHYTKDDQFYLEYKP